MNLPTHPSPAYLTHPQPSSSPVQTPPISRPGSPALSAGQEAAGWDTPAERSRASSRSKDPLFKVPRRGRGSRGGWWTEVLGSLGGVGGAQPKEVEKERGRRPSVANESQGVARSLGRREVQQLEGRKQRGWRDKVQLGVSFAMIGLVGMNDSATGANLDSMQTYYGVTYDYISLVFLANVAGYFISCLSSSFLTHSLGLRSTLHLASLTLSAACLTLSFAPPFGAFIFALALMGFGGGLYDSAITTVISHAEDGALMSYTYAFFGVGATFAPLIVAALVDRGVEWSRYYYVPMAISIMLAGVAHFAFSNFQPPADESHTHEGGLELSIVPSHTNAPSTLHPTPSASSSTNQVHGGPRATMSVQTRMARSLKMPIVWVGFVLIILAFGTSDTLSGWVVSYIIEKRGSPEGISRYILAGLWGGIAIGRVVLAYFLDDRLGERSFSVLMLALASGFLGVVWGVRNYTVDAVAIILVGFFIGPVTPKVLSTVSARCPPSLKSSVMSLTIGLGLIGSAVGPLLFGMVAGRGGLASLPGVLIVMSGIAGGVWCCVPRNKRRED